MTRGLSIQQRAASRFVVGFDGTTMTPELAEFLNIGVGGVILFRRNINDPLQAAALNAEIINATKGRPIFISVDQEGGPVQRLRSPFTEFPPHGVLGQIDDPKLTGKVANVIATELRALGFNTDYAPVADVNTNPANPVIGVRSFGSDAAMVARHVKAWVTGMQAAGVMACAKHFPGHGDTAQDSHFELPRLKHDRKRMEAVELVPFRAAMSAKVGSIMTAHVVFEALERNLPATLSRKTLGQLLRKDMKYDGLVFSDDLEMKAIADRIGVPAAAVTSLDAGADLLLVCKTRQVILDSIEAVAKALEQGKLKNAPVSEKRIAAARKRFLIGAGKSGDGLHKPPKPEIAMRVIGKPTHKKIAADVAKRAKKAGSPWAPPTVVAASPVSIT